MFGIKRQKFDGAWALAQEHLGHDLTLTRLDDDAVVAAHLSARLDDQHIAVAIKRHHAFALHLKRIDTGLLRGAGRKFHHIPALARRKAAIVEKAAGARLRKAEQWN